MSVIIRLQNLPWSANALDIRQFFRGLSIPEGGVHIVGGEQGDAFIAFSTDEDARQAFNLNNGKIKEVQIKLMLSSRTEMQKVIEAARNQSLAAFMQSSPTQAPSAVPPILPSVIPSTMPDAKKDDKDNNVKVDKRDKRRSRSRSRERKERDRDRRDNRRRRDRSRSRSRERRDRRRRDRSRSRDRTRSKERDRRSKDRRSIESSSNTNASNNKEPKVVWEPPIPNEAQAQAQSLTLLGSYPPAAALLAAAAVAGAAGNPTALLEERVSFQAQNQREGFGPRWTNPNHHTSEGPNNTNSFQNRRFQNDDRFNDNAQQFQGRPRPGGMEQFNKNSYNDSRPGFNSRQMKNDVLNTRFNNSSDRQDRHQGDFTNCCVQMHPYYGGFGEVRRFFQGIFIHNTGIKFVNDDFGKRTGVCYIKCAYPEGKEEALARSGSLLKHQVVEITHLDDEEFDSIPDRYQPDHQYQDDDGDSESSRHFRGKNITKYFNKNSGNQSQSPPPKIFSCLVVEDLPNYAKEQDILKMFSEYPLMSIIMVSKPRKVHVAYVQFSNPEDAKTAQQETNKHIVDGKPVTVKPCRDDVFDTVQRQQSEILEEPESSANYIKTDCILLSRLPLKTNDRDISDFFSDVGIIPTKIHLLSNNMGFIGEAYCEFATIEEVRVAIEKNAKPLGSSIVSVKPVDRSDMESALGIHVIPDSPSPPHPLPQQQINRPPLLGPGMGQPRQQFFPRNNFVQGLRGPGFMGGPRPRRFVPPHLQADEPFGPPGCTVLMENVPYKATVDEILQFFDGYDVPADNILRRYNPNGKPSGESKVIFKDPDEAYQAVNQKQQQKIRDRTVYLTLV